MGVGSVANPNNSLEAREPRLVRDSSNLFLAEFIQVLFGILTVAIIVRELPPERYGAWVAVLALFQFTTIANFGFPTFIARNIPKNRENAYHIIGKIRKVQIFLIILVAILCATIAYNSLEIDILNPPIIIIGLATMSIVLTQINKSTLVSLGLASMNVRVILVDRSLTLVAILFVMYFLGSEELYLLIGYILGPMVGLLLSEYYARGLLKGEIHSKDDLFTTKDIVGESAPYSLNLIAMPAFDSINRLTIMLYSGAVSLAIFDVSFRVFQAGNSVTRSIRNAMLPVLSFNSDGEGGFETSLDAALRMVSWVLPVGLLGGHVGGLAIPIVFSSEYAESSRIFFILLVSWAIMLINSPWLSTVQSIKSPSSFSLIVVVSVTVGVLSSITLIPRVGLVGAALAVLTWQSSSALVCISLCRDLYFKRGFGTNFAKLMFIAISYSFSIFAIVSNEMPMRAHLVPPFVLLVWMRVSNWRLETFKMFDQQRLAQ